jgi:hypothetical protein
MAGFLKTVLKELTSKYSYTKTTENEEHVDALARFLAAVAPKVALKEHLERCSYFARSECPSLNMKSRFKLEDASEGFSLERSRMSPNLKTNVSGSIVLR